MFEELSFTEFLKRYPNNDMCLKEIVKIRYPKGIFCQQCKKYTTHYRVKNRPAYSCQNCRTQTYPLAGTIFEKTTTSLRLWFYAMFLMTHTKGKITVKQLQRELGVTYKTAWRIYKRIHMLMAQNNGDLLVDSKVDNEDGKDKVKRWVFFKRFEISFVEKENTSS